MLAGRLENGPLIRKVAEVLASCKKLILTLTKEKPDAQLNKELERLALAAPHMLADMGFDRDAKVCSFDKAVWRRGTHCVIIYSAKRAAAFT